MTTLSGKLGSKQIQKADTYEKVYTVPVNMFGTLFITVAHGLSSTVKMTLAVSSSSSVQDKDILVVSQDIPSGSFYSRNGLVCSAGESVYVKCSVKDPIVNVDGILIDLTNQ